jgi:hypothetical protein
MADIANTLGPKKILSPLNPVSVSFSGRNNPKLIPDIIPSNEIQNVDKTKKLVSLNNKVVSKGLDDSDLSDLTSEDGFPEPNNEVLRNRNALMIRNPPKDTPFSKTNDEIAFEKRKTDLVSSYTSKLLEIQQNQEAEFENNTKTLLSSFNENLTELTSIIRKALDQESKIIKHKVIIEYEDGSTPKVDIPNNEFVEKDSILFVTHSKFRGEFKAQVEELAFDVMNSYIERESTFKSTLECSNAQKLDMLKEEYAQKYEVEKMKIESDCTANLIRLKNEKKSNQGESELLKTNQERLLKLKGDQDTEIHKLETLKIEYQDKIKQSSIKWEKNLADIEINYKSKESEYLKRVDKANAALAKDIENQNKMTDLKLQMNEILELEEEIERRKKNLLIDREKVDQQEEIKDITQEKTISSINEPFPTNTVDRDSISAEKAKKVGIKSSIKHQTSNRMSTAWDSDSSSVDQKENIYSRNEVHKSKATYRTPLG